MKHFLYLNFRVVSAWQHWLMRRFTAAGRLALAALVASAVVGVDTNQTMAYQVFTFVVGLLAVAVCGSLLFKGRFEVRRLAPKLATVGEPCSYQVQVSNVGDRAFEGLSLLEDQADPRPSLSEFLAASDPVGERRNAFDRAVGYHRWARLVARRRRAAIPEQGVPHLASRSEVELRMGFTPEHRGSLRLTGITIARSDPLGLFRGLLAHRAPHTVTVLPRRYRLPAIGLPGRRMYQHGGVTLASSVGDSEEFMSLRDYRPGDPLKRIHWKNFARVGKPVVKEYQDEFFERHALVLDTYAGRGRDSVFEEAVSVAASLASTIDTQECLLDLLFVGNQAYCYTGGRGQLRTENLLEILAGVQLCSEHEFSLLRQSVLGRRVQLSSCILILLAWDGPRQELVQSLRALGLPLLVLVIAEPDRAPAGIPDWISVLEVGKIQQGLARL